MRNSLTPLLLLVFSTQLAFWASQGLGFFEQPLLVAKGQRAADTADPPLLQNLAFALRFFVALLSDAMSPCGLGHRLPYIVAGQAVAAAALVVAGAVPPTPGGGWAAYLAAAFFRSFSIVAATSAMDGLLVDGAIGGGGVMGRVQAARATGTVVGQLLANLGGGALADAFGLPALAFFLAALALPWAAAPLALVGGAVEERARGGGDSGEARRSGGGLGAARAACAACVGGARAFWSAPAAAALALSTLSFAGQTVGNFPLVLFLVGRKGLTLLDNGVLNTVFAIAGWLGSLAAAWLLERGDVRVPTAVAQLTSAALTAAVLWTPAGHAFVFNAALNVVGGLATGLRGDHHKRRGAAAQPARPFGHLCGADCGDGQRGGAAGERVRGANRGEWGLFWDCFLDRRWLDCGGGPRRALSWRRGGAAASGAGRSRGRGVGGGRKPALGGAS
jgi:hypothetical protein